MYYDNGEGMVFRPPSEANSFILRVTIGCSHNRCAFCRMYADVSFRIREWPEIDRQIQLAARHAPDLRRVFLADGNALVLSNGKLLTILEKLQAAFPKLSRVACYGGPRDILTKSAGELSALKAAGLHTVYLGLESGSDQVLTLLDKGATAAEMIEAGRMILDAGIKLSLMVILGAGGREYSRVHGIETAKAVNAIQPTMLAALTLMLHEGSALQAKVRKGEFSPLSDYEVLRELRLLVAELEMPPERPCIFRSNHVSNLLPLAGNFPKDKTRLLAEIDQMLGVMACSLDGLNPHWEPWRL